MTGILVKHIPGFPGSEQGFRRSFRQRCPFLKPCLSAACCVVTSSKQDNNSCHEGFSAPGTYGLALLGSWKPCASACWGLSGGGWGRRAGSAGWAAPCAGDWMTPLRPPSTPFMPSCGLPASDAMRPPTTGSEEPPAWPLSRGWTKEAGLCWGGGVLWKEREELLRDGLPEWNSWNRHSTAAVHILNAALAASSHTSLTTELLKGT